MMKFTLIVILFWCYLWILPKAIKQRRVRREFSELRKNIATVWRTDYGR